MSENKTEDEQKREIAYANIASEQYNPFMAIQALEEGATKGKYGLDDRKLLKKWIFPQTAVSPATAGILRGIYSEQFKKASESEDDTNLYGGAITFRNADVLKKGADIYNESLSLLTPEQLVKIIYGDDYDVSKAVKAEENLDELKTTLVDVTVSEVREHAMKIDRSVKISNLEKKITGQEEKK
jgi:hypothetical protein